MTRGDALQWRQGTASVAGIGAGTPAFVACLLIVTLLYVAAARAGLQLAVVGSTVTLLWAPSGIALAALLVFGPRMALGVGVGAFIANAWTGIPPTAALAIALGNTLEAAVGAALLLRVLHFGTRLETLRDALSLIAAAAGFSTLLSALVGVSTLAWIGTISWVDGATVGLKWWLGDMMGVLVVTPLLLLLLTRPLRAPTWREALEVACLLTALVLVSLKIFGANEAAARGHYATSLLIFPFVIWGALRFDQWGASLVTLVVSALAVWGTAQGTGPFAVEQAVDSLMRWCAFAIVTAVTGLLMAATVAGQRRAQDALKRSHAELEQRVQARTADLAAAGAKLAQEMAEGRRLEAALIRISEDQQQSLGRELHDGLGQLLTSVSLMTAALQQQLLAARQQPEAATAARINQLIAEATAMTRSVARGLYPVALEFGGLSAALQELAEQTRTLLKIDCQFSRDPQAREPSPPTALNLYRVAQEAVANAVKHSQARHLRLALSRADGSHQQLSITDDGLGIDPARLSPGSGLGLASMRFRASVLGGHLDVQTRGASGTTVTLTYPDDEAFHRD